MRCGGAEGGRDRRDDGSAVVVAAAAGLIVVVVVSMLTTRSLGDSIASAARIEAAQARALAEYGVAMAIAELNNGLASEFRRATIGGQRSILLPPPPGWEHGRTTSPEIVLEIRHDAANDTVRIVSTAEVGGRTKLVDAEVRLRTSADYLLLTEHEVVDPMLFRGPRLPCTFPRGDERRGTGCIATSLPGGVLDGPVHSNDVIAIGEDVVIASMLTTSRLGPSGDRVVPALAPESARAGLADAPFGLQHAPEVRLPRSVASVARDTVVTCRFRGPTLIRLDGPIARVTSPRSVVRDGEVETGDEAIGCLGVDRSLLVAPTVIPLPERAVIEIVRDTRSDCVRHPLSITAGEDAERDWWCQGGDAFVWGNYQGTRTIMAQDNIQLVWDVVRAAGADGALGLVAGDSIVLRRIVGRPIRGSADAYGPNVAFAGAGIPPFGAYPDDAPNAAPSTWDAPTVVAALVALRGSVGVQNPRLGTTHPGPVAIEGSLVARFRGLFSWEHSGAGAEAPGSMGYPLVLRYDRNLIDSPPPGLPVTHGGTVRILRLGVAR